MNGKARVVLFISTQTHRFLTCNTTSALEADVILLNELGLDPGLDHMSAVSMRKKIEATGRKVVGFKSWCGGLPAPENSDVCISSIFL
jgi:alpha-aminoadipic semialdehyde synthase